MSHNLSNLFRAFAVAICMALVLDCITMAEDSLKVEEGSGKAAKAAPVFAFVALNKYQPVTEERFRNAIHEVAGQNIKIGRVESDDKGVTAEIDGRSCMVTLIRFPIPAKDLEWAYRASWTWPGAAKSMKSHRVHLIAMVVPSKEGQLEDCVFLTKLLAAITRMYDCAGIYWGHASLLLSPDQIRQFGASASAEEPPILAWVSFNRLESAPGTLSVGTEGLAYFGCRELEVINSRKSIEDILNLMAGVAYILVKGEAIADGDTVGGEDDPKERIKTHYAKSTRDGVGDALRVEY